MFNIFEKIFNKLANNHINKQIMIEKNRNLLYNKKSSKVFELPFFWLL